MLKEVLIILVMLSAIPVGWLLAYLTREELAAGRKYFVYILILCLLGIFILLFLRLSYWVEIILGLIYLGIISLVSLKLSFRKSFVKN